MAFFFKFGILEKIEVLCGVIEGWLYKEMNTYMHKCSKVKAHYGGPLWGTFGSSIIVHIV